MSRDLFERVADALGGMLPVELAEFEHVAHGVGIKVWWPDAPREHYEAQLVRGSEYAGPALEVGFHAEHPDPQRNESIVAALTAPGTGWRRALGADATAGAFLGSRPRPWRRVSEVWDGVDVEEPDLPIEVADRLARYIAVLEPIRRAAT